MPGFMLLQRNLIYTGITRANQLLVLVGQKKALGSRSVATSHANDTPGSWNWRQRSKPKHHTKWS
jgi:ATP-dependent exoDNAse (exonuclease V) alpha subunit